jgi:hypothetical protein
MKTVVVRVLAGSALATLLVLVLALAFPGRRTEFFDAYELVLGALALAALVASIRTLRPERWERSAFEGKRDSPSRPEAITELERIDRLVVLGASNSFDLHYRLRPLLRDLAAERLHAGYGVELEGDRARAQALLGDELWEVVRPERELEHRSGPGLSLAGLERVVRALEAL